MHFFFSKLLHRFANSHNLLFKTCKNSNNKNILFISFFTTTTSAFYIYQNFQHAYAKESIMIDLPAEVQKQFMKIRMVYVTFSQKSFYLRKK